jgi:hypothetical protein
VIRSAVKQKVPQVPIWDWSAPVSPQWKIMGPMRCDYMRTFGFYPGDMQIVESIESINEVGLENVQRGSFVSMAHQAFSTTFIVQYWCRGPGLTVRTDVGDIHILQTDGWHFFLDDERRTARLHPAPSVAIAKADSPMTVPAVQLKGRLVQFPIPQTERRTAMNPERHDIDGVFAGAFPRMPGAD